MKIQKRVYDMTDRELRAYKRQQRRKREIRRRCIIAVLSLCIVFVSTLSYRAFRSNADTGADEIKFKYYTNISVAYGETLWELADRYMDEEMYQNRDAYISEVVSINHLEDGDIIREGQHLVIPYYSTEYIK